MKHFILLFAAVISHASTAQDKTVLSIREKYAKIKSLEPKMQKQKLDSAGGDSAEGSSAVIYRQKGEIMEIREEFLGESGKNTYTFFYEAQEPFFALQEETFYSLPHMETVPDLPKPKKTVIEHRFYFDHGKLIKWLKAGVEVNLAEKSAKERGTEIYEDAKNALKLE